MRASPRETSARTGRAAASWPGRKDGRTHLAHKAEHAVDLDTGAVVAVTLQGADLGDTVTLDATLSLSGATSYRHTVNQLLKSVVRQIRT